MHIHLPKPLHGWREFLGEIAIVVIGVLIALGAEQMVEAVHERSRSAEARESVRFEIGANLADLQGRLEKERCIRQRLEEIGSLLAAAGEGAPNPHPTWISRPTFWSFSASAWQAATAAGRAALLPEKDQLQLAWFFTNFELVNREQEREQSAWAHLRGLEDWRGPLGPTARFGFAQALQDARYSDYRIGVVIGNIVLRAEKAGIAIGPSALRRSRAICLPITMPRAQAERTNASPFGDPR